MDNDLEYFTREKLMEILADQADTIQEFVSTECVPVSEVKYYAEDNARLRKAIEEILNVALHQKDNEECSYCFYAGQDIVQRCEIALGLVDDDPTG